MAKPVREATESVWMETAEVTRHRSLSKDVQADVCVVGAGIAGLTTAYLLAREGKSVVVLDDGPVAGGQTQRTTAHLSNAIDDRFTEIEKIHGAEGSDWRPRATPPPSTGSRPSPARRGSTATSSASTATCSWRPASPRTCSTRGARGRPPRRPRGCRVRAPGAARLLRHGPLPPLPAPGPVPPAQVPRRPGGGLPQARRGRSTPILMHRRIDGGRVETEAGPVVTAGVGRGRHQHARSTTSSPSTPSRPPT